MCVVIFPWLRGVPLPLAIAGLFAPPPAAAGAEPAAPVFSRVSCAGAVCVGCGFHDVGGARRNDK